MREFESVLGVSRQLEERYLVMHKFQFEGQKSSPQSGERVVSQRNVEFSEKAKV